MSWFSNLFGGKNKEQSDPLAGLRAQLQALSSQQQALAGQVPGMVSRQKELIGKTFGEARKTSMENLQEQMHGVRGFGASSLEPKYMATELDRLARSQAEEELNAEMSGLKLQGDILGQSADILGGTSNMYPKEEESNALSRILGGVGTIGGMAIGNMLFPGAGGSIGAGMGGLLSRIVAPESESGDVGGYRDWAEQIKKAGGISLFSGRS